MKKIEFLNGKYIGYPCTPSQWVSEPEYTKISRLLMTSGGGIGGSKWYELVERIDKDTELSGIQTFKTIKGKNIRLNPSYIVKIEDCTLVTVNYETTNRNFTNSKLLLTKQFFIEDGQEVVLIDDYAETAKKMNKSSSF